MSHSDSEIGDEMKDKMRRQLHSEFKIKDKRSPWDNRDFKKKIKRVEFFLQEFRLVRAVNHHNTNEVKRLLEAGVSANTTDTVKRSALHIAVSKGYVDIVKLLLEHGADPNQRDSIQNTPLHLAACIHNLAIITLLINFKADVSSLDLHGRNPLQLASSKLQILQRGWREGAIEMINLRAELQQVIDLLLSILNRQQEAKTDVNDLQLMKLSLDTDPAENLDNQMSKLLNDIQKFSLS